MEHASVLWREVASLLAPRGGARMLDATLGLGGHAARLLDAAGPEARLLGLDRDPMALAEAGRRLERFGGRAVLVQSDFRRMATASAGFLEPGRAGFDAILMDLGVSSPQLDLPERGFSFMADGPLDMRMDPTAGATAAEWLNGAEEAEIARVLWEYGEERESRRVARAIVRARPLGRTLQLAEAVSAALGGRRGEKRHPATRTFQALRIKVNDELGALQEALPQALALLAPGGRLGVISFHSLEDRAVKEWMAENARGCICPPRLPECRCGHTPTLRPVTRKAVTAAEDELEANPRARSAKLRVAEKI